MNSISAKRKNDAVITVCQDNTRKQLIIESMNNAAERLTGYQSSEVIHQLLSTVLPPHINEAVEGGLEFDTAGHDLADVLRRINHFEIITKDGKDIPVSLKVFYVVSSHMGKPEFELLIRDVTVLRKIDELKERVKQQRSGKALNQKLGIPEKDIFLESLGLVHNATIQHTIEASLAMFEIDHVKEHRAEYSAEVGEDIMKSVCDLVIENLREGDLLGYLGNDVFALLLLDCNADDAQAVLNRIRMTIESAIFESVHLTKRLVTSLSMGYTQISPEKEPKALLETCEKALAKSKKSGGNTIST